MKPLKHKLHFLRYLLLTCAALCCIVSGSWAHTLSARSEHTKVTLLPQYDSLMPGQQATFGFLFEMDEHWHTYWRNPGDSGFSIVIEWVVPDGYAVSEVVWPNPHRLIIEPLTSYGYEGSALLLSTISVPASAAMGTQAQFTINLKWLECRIECVPGSAQFDLIMPIASDPALDPIFQNIFEQHKATFPSNAQPINVEGFEDERMIMLRLNGQDIEGMDFFPFENGLINNHSQQLFAKSASGGELIVEKSPTLGGQALEKIEGLLIVHDAGSAHAKSYEIKTELQTYIAPKASAIHIAKQNPLIIALFAFLGGLILNLMPCVLPVLSIKILNLVESANKGKRSILLDGLSFSMGILVSFWFLAFFMITLKAAGHYVGWGFQFQSPVFVVFMAVLFFWLSLNLFGIFEVDLGSARIENAVRNSFLLKNSFLNGILATVVATPCTAPFMGTALGYALSQTALTTFLIFTSLGLGLASPYMILSLRPDWLKFIPKPGPWMIVMKKVFGAMFMASVLWLAWVLDVQRGQGAVINLGLGLAVIALAAWVIGRFAALNQNKSRRWQARLVAVALFIIGFGIALYGAMMQETKTDTSKQQGAIHWEDFSQDRLSQLRREGKAVFVDFTATWCLTCQVNERVAIYHPKVVAMIKEKGIVMMKADWTNYDASITKALEGYGKNSIPVYVIYASGSNEPVFLPELLTPKMVLDALDKI